MASLYTSIPHGGGINAVVHAHEERQSPTISRRVLLKFLSPILYLNKFIFDDENYLQTKGCAMRSKCSSSYANISMGKFETDKVYPKIDGKHQCYICIRDDIFMIWTTEEKRLK